MLLITIGYIKPRSREGVVGGERVGKFENNDIVVIFILYCVSHNRRGGFLFLVFFFFFFKIALEMHVYEGKQDSQNSVMKSTLDFMWQRQDSNQIY